MTRRASNLAHVHLLTPRRLVLVFILGTVGASLPAAARPTAPASATSGIGRPETVHQLLEKLDSRLTDPRLSGMTRLGPNARAAHGESAAQVSSASARNFFYSGILNPGDVDGDSKDDVMFYGLDRENQLILRFFRGSDGERLWSMAEPLRSRMVLYVDFGDFAAGQGSDIVLLKTEYRQGESHSGLLDAYREDTLIQRLSTRRGSDGSINWEQDRSATITTRDVSPLETLPWHDYVIEKKGVIDILHPVGGVTGAQCEDLFISTVDSRWTERTAAFGFLPTIHYLSWGRVKASIVDGCAGEEAAAFTRESDDGVPFAYAVGDVSGDDLMDVAATVPGPDDVVRVELNAFDGTVVWSQLIPGNSARVSGVPLLSRSPNDLIIVAETVVDVEDETSTVATFAKRGSDGGHLWSIERELVPHRLGDVDGDGTQELLMTDSVDPASATTISAASGPTLAVVWGPLPISKEVEGATVDSRCVCPALADFDGDGVEDLGGPPEH